MGICRSRGGDVVVSRHRALSLWRLPLWDVDRQLVVLSADVEETATRAGFRVTPLRGLVARQRVEGLQVQAVADALVTTASLSVEGAVVAADAALRTGACSLPELEEARRRLLAGLRGRHEGPAGRSLLSTQAASRRARAAPVWSCRRWACPLSRRP